MISRGFDSTYRAGCAGAPPPLHVTDDNPQSAWFPVKRPALIPQPAGPHMIYVPTPAPYGDDPLNPAGQEAPRQRTDGMVGRLNFRFPGAGAEGQGVRH